MPRPTVGALIKRPRAVVLVRIDASTAELVDRDFEGFDTDWGVSQFMDEARAWAVDLEGHGIHHLIAAIDTTPLPDGPPKVLEVSVHGPEPEVAARLQRSLEMSPKRLLNDSSEGQPAGHSVVDPERKLDAVSKPGVPRPPVLEELARALGGANVQLDDNHITFEAAGAVIEANAKDGATRLRIRAYLGSDEPAVVEGWAKRQPRPSSGVLQAFTHADGVVEPRIVFERPIKGKAWSIDLILSDIAQFLDAWANDEVVGSDSAGSWHRYAPEADPRDMPPSSAWLLLGDSASFPSPNELTDQRVDGTAGVFDCLWTAAKQTIVGDLALIYFLAPHKAAHFIARAASNAFFARDILVNAEGSIADEQRWAYLTPLIEIEPITFKVLQAAADGHLILKGRSGKFLRPQMLQALPIRAKDPSDQPELDRVLETPIGLAELPRPEAVTIDIWRAIAPGALPLEAHVSSHIVEPLLTHVLDRTRFTWKREHRTGAGTVDFVVLDQGTPCTAIEVKLATIEPPDGDWAKSKDLLQLRRYTDALGVDGVLIDAHRLLLVKRGQDRPYRDLSRRDITVEDIRILREHLLGRG